MLLLWGLSNKYLWQDEAATAVLSERMLHFGRPLAYDGVNLITIDYFKTEDPATIDQRTTDPHAAVQYYIRRGDFKPDTSWRFQPWGQFVVTGISLKILGATTLAARLPFALAGIATVLLLYRFVLANFGNRLLAFLAALFLVFNSYWILHSRQCRYYSLSSSVPRHHFDSLRSLATGWALGWRRLCPRGMVLVPDGLRNILAGHAGVVR